MRIVISSEARLLHLLRSAVKFHAEAAGFAAASVESLALAVNEAASNVIRHAYGSRPDGMLALEIATFADRMEFVLEDSAPKVEPELIRPRNLEEVRPGGLGTFFINHFMDETTFDCDCPHGNRLIMIKYLPGKVSTEDENSGQKGGSGHHH